MKFRWIGYLGMVFILTSCATTAKTAWDDIVQKCAHSELNGKLFYFGPSNSIGPTSIFVPSSNGGYTLRKAAVNPEVVIADKEFTCGGVSTKKFSSKAALAFSSEALPVSASVQNDFSKARSVQVKATGMRWEQVEGIPFDSYINNLAADDAVRLDLQKGDRLVIKRALRVFGFAADYEFNQEDAVALQAKYSGDLGKKITGEVGADLNATWTSNTTLSIKSQGDIFIAGELNPYQVGVGFAGGIKKNPFGPALDHGTEIVPLKIDAIK